jgi:pyruvate/2-oxoglutarate dehydrogenase complex dihydrolipoamide acyltransferase (E2) component
MSTISPFGTARTWRTPSEVSRATAAQLGRPPPTRTAAETATPVVKALAASREVDLNTVTPTGVGNRITSADVLAAASGSTPRRTPAADPDMYESAWGADTATPPAPRAESTRRPTTRTSSTAALYDLAWPGNEATIPGADSFPVATEGN